MDEKTEKKSDRIIRMPEVRHKTGLSNSTIYDLTKRGLFYVVMVDDVGTKVSFEKFDDCRPSWIIETSPGNHQFGFIFAKPITDLNLVDELKERLIEAGLCDPGASGGIRLIELVAAQSHLIGTA